MPAIFTPELESELRLNKYVRWVFLQETSDSHLVCMLRCIGEFEESQEAILGFLVRNYENFRGSRLSCLALEGLHCMARGDRFNQEEWARRTHSGRIGLAASDLPAAIQQAADAAYPGISWDWAMSIDEGHEIGGSDPAGKRAYAYVTPEGRVIYAGPDRKRGEMLNPPGFSQELVAAISKEPLARWSVARPLSMENFICVLFLIGEFEARSHELRNHFAARKTELSEAERSLVALEALCQMVRFRERFDVVELEQRMSRGRGHLTADDLPLPVRKRLQDHYPGVAWEWIWKKGDDYEALGKDQKGQTVDVLHSRSGSIRPYYDR